MDTTEKKIWVIGHKNPDTDSICSAIAYANLKNKTSGNRFVPKRAGMINQETEFVLKYFGAEVPEMVSDVGTQVQDIAIRKTPGISENWSLKRAWEQMKEIGVVTLPIVSKRMLQGLITITDITNAYMNVHDNQILSQAKTPLINIVETLDGTLIVGDGKGYFSKGKVLIAAANPDLMESYIEKGDLVILGNRYESQLCALEMNAGVLVVCDGAPVSKTIQKMAQEHKCTVIGTQYDTFTVARLINQSMPVKYFMTVEKLVCFHLEDQVDDIWDTMARLRHRDFPILNHLGQYQGMISRRNLLGAARKQIILVDHNERSQAADGIENAEILEIIDHHRLGTIETISPVFFRNQPLGCTATIIYQMYQEACVPIDRQMAGLLLSAIISDTLLFRSPTCTEFDRQAAAKLGTIAQVNVDKYAREMFSASSGLSGKSPEEIFYQDFKEFLIGEYQVGIGQINLLSADELELIQEKLRPYLSVAMEKHGMQMVYFMLTNIIEETTELMCEGTEGVSLAQLAFEKEIVDGAVMLPGVVSRKKQLVPALTLGLQGIS